MRLRIPAILLMIVGTPLLADAAEMNAVGVSFGGSWMTQDYQYVEGSEFQSPVDGGFFGPVIGAFANIGLIDRFSGVVEAFYIQKGYKSTFITTDTSGERIGERTETYYAHYMSVPFSVRFEFSSYGVMPYVYAGVGAEILLGHGDSGMFGEFKDVNLSGHLGIGLAWERFGIDFRYMRDLTSAADSMSLLDSVTNEGIVGMLTVSVWP